MSFLAIFALCGNCEVLYYGTTSHTIKKAAQSILIAFVTTRYDRFSGWHAYTGNTTHFGTVVHVVTLSLGMLIWQETRVSSRLETAKIRLGVCIFLGVSVGFAKFACMNLVWRQHP